MLSQIIENGIYKLEKLSKDGESYATSNGDFGWRNPIRKDTGRIIQSLVIATNPKNILEIGTAHGLSALYLYKGLRENSETTFDTIEFDVSVAKSTQEFFQNINVPINVHAGEAMEVIAKLNKKYDLVFFDAQKTHYGKQLNLLIEKQLLSSNCTILADNVIDRQDECKDFLDWFIINKINHTIIKTECGLLVANL